VELAHKAGLSQNVVTNFETNKVIIDKTEARSIFALSMALEMNPFYLMYGPPYPIESKEVTGPVAELIDMLRNVSPDKMLTIMSVVRAITANN
jgi:hypothetical protein